MLKRILSKKLFFSILVTAALLMALSIYAVGGNEPEVKSLSLDDAIDSAVKTSLDLKLADLGIERADIKYRGAVKTAADMDIGSKTSKSGVTMDMAYQFGLAEWYAPKAAEVELTMAEKKREQAENQLKKDVEGAYYNVLKNERNLKIRREYLNYVQNQLKIAQTGYKVGVRAKVDITVAEAAVAQSQALVVQEENNYRGAVMNLNKLIGFPLDTQVKLTSQFAVDKISSKIDLQKTIEDSLADNVTIIGLKHQEELSQVQYDVAKKFYGGGVTTFETALVDKKMAEVNVQKTELTLMNVIKQNHLTLSTLEQMMDWQTKEVEKAKENAHVFALKYEAGLATSQDAKKAAIDLEQSEETLSETIYQYNLLKLNFKYNLFLSSSSAG